MHMMPKRLKHRKSQRGSIRGIATRNNRVVLGDFGLMSLESYWLTARQIEACRVTAARYLGTRGRVFIRVFPDKPVSAKPAETRQGKGKGDTEYWAAVIRPGNILFEVGGVDLANAKGALARMAHKLPIRVKLVERRRLI